MGRPPPPTPLLYADVIGTDRQLHLRSTVGTTYRLLHSPSKSKLRLPFTGYVHNVTLNIVYTLQRDIEIKNVLKGYVTSNNTDLVGFFPTSYIKNTV